MTIQWRKDGDVIATDNDEDRYTFDGPRLNVEKVIGQDAGQYTCTAVRGDEQVTSPAVTLNIQCESNCLLSVKVPILDDSPCDPPLRTGGFTPHPARDSGGAL